MVTIEIKIGVRATIDSDRHRVEGHHSGQIGQLIDQIVEVVRVKIDNPINLQIGLVRTRIGRLGNRQIDPPLVKIVPIVEMLDLSNLILKVVSKGGAYSLVKKIPHQKDEGFVFCY